MMSSLIKINRIAYALGSAITLTLLSVCVERAGPELAQYGDSIFKPELRGGFPIAYLFDAPGISREGQLAFVEDKLFVGAFFVDIAIYFAIILLATLVVSHYWSAYKKGAGRTSS